MKKMLLVAALPALALLWAMARAEKPAVIACVDLSRVFAGLEMKKAADARMNEVAKAESARRDKQVAEIQALQAEINDFKRDTPAYNDANRKLTDAAAKLRAIDEFGKRKMEFEAAQSVKTMYQAVKTTLADLGKEQGIDLVLLDDSTAPFDPSDPRPVTQQISARRTLWFNPSLDVTDALIKRMNDAYAAGKTK
jgi:Skp family chaperone for outer membrane proteins